MNNNSLDMFVQNINSQLTKLGVDVDADFGNALLAIMKHKLNEKNGEYSSIQEYLDKWNKIKSNLNNIKEKIGI